MRTFMLTLLLVIGLALTAIDASAFKNEPEGFMGLSWGAPVGMPFTEDDFVGYSSDEKSYKYQKISDTEALEVNNVKLYGIVYSFYNKMLWKVEVEARLLQAGKLLDTFIAKYGDPSSNSSVSEFKKEYDWTGSVTDITLVTSLNFYDKKTPDIATATTYSKKIKSTIDADLEPFPTESKHPIDVVDGFRGRKWGSGFDTLVSYQPLDQEPFFEYLIKDDSMVFEGINANEIRYRFHNDKILQKVELFFSGKQNYIKLKKACFRLFGNTSRYEHGNIKWIGKTTTVSLSFIINAKGEWLSRLTYFGFGSP